LNKVYKHLPLARDEYLGRVNSDGKVYEARFGPDKYVGRVEIDTGKIYEARHGPDKQIGRVALDSGKVFLSRLGPDEYFGKVNGDGKIYLHNRMATDDYLGKVVDMTSFAHGGGAFLLLVQPAYDEEARKEAEAEKNLGETDAGEAAAPA
jgi:hypothetical protein